MPGVSTNRELLSGLHAVRTRARYALFLEAAGDPDVYGPMHAQREGMATWSRSLLTTLGARHPETATRAFMAFADGIVLHRLSVDPRAPVRESVAVAVRGCLDA